MLKGIIHSKSVTLFHTHVVTSDLLEQALEEYRSIDLDICVSEEGGQPYLGHSDEYHTKSGVPQYKTMKLDEVITRLEIHPHKIPVMLDCKHYAAWQHLVQFIERLGSERCLVNSYVHELRFRDHQEEFDIEVEYVPIDWMANVVKKYPDVVVSASARNLSSDCYRTPQIDHIERCLKEHAIDTISFNTNNNVLSLSDLLICAERKIIPNIEIDRYDEMPQVHVLAETNHLSSADRFGHHML